LNASQLTTYQLTGNYQLSQSHGVLLSLDQQRSEVKTNGNYSTQHGLNISWSWHAFEGIQVNSYFRYFKSHRSILFETRRSQRRQIGLRVAYQW